ncbi:ArsR/SmtB family transcription factor [Halosimplex halobium]|uniref:ArsR/SmtB family transcription factor n=1 Tax=Halosimplex halobium TaxID=3396618 RepID=UPI003F576BD7
MSGQNNFTRRMPTATGADDGGVELSVEDKDVFAVADAIGSKPRWRLLRTVAEEPHTIDELVDALDLSKGTISVHISKFEDAGIFEANYAVSDDGGVKKELRLAVDEVTLDLASL